MPLPSVVGGPSDIMPYTGRIKLILVDPHYQL